MNTIEAIETRRSVKSFDNTHNMPTDIEEKLLSAALLSPTAYNIQNWRFVVVRESSILEKIKEAAWGQSQITDCSMLVVLCADLKAWEKEPTRYWQNADEQTRDYLLPLIDGYYRDKPQVQRDEAMRSCGLAAQSLMLASRELGYDSCPMDGFDFEEVANIINLPDDHVISMFVAIGKKTEEAWPRGGQLKKSEIIVRNQF